MSEDAPYRPLYREVPRRPAPPPRSVPLSLRWALRTGGVLGMVGWGGLAFSSIFMWIFVANSDAITALTFRGETATATGRVTDVSATSMTENDRTVMEISFTFTDAAGREHSGHSYSTGGYYQGDVAVEYLVDDPDTARIEGLRMRPFSDWTLLLLIFPVVMLIPVVATWVRGRKAVRLLRIGAMGSGVLVDRQPTNTRINDQIVWEYTFEFEVDGRKYRAKGRTHRSELTDDEQEPLLYDPSWPPNATMLDHLPGKPRVTEQGAIEMAWRPAMLGAIGLPILFLFVNVVAWMIYTAG